MAVHPELRGVKLLILDLDNTLCDTFHDITKEQWLISAAALERTGALAAARVMRKGPYPVGFAATLNANHVTDTQKRAALRAYNKMSVTPLHLFSDAKIILSHPARKVLLTRGEIPLQKRKLRHLKIRSHFEKVYIATTFEKKKPYLQRILRDFKLKPSEILVIGDRPWEEILDGKQLGMRTCLVLRPDWHIGRSPVKPTITVKSFKSLVTWLPTGKP